MRLADLLSRAHPHRRALVAISALQLGAALAALAIPWLAGQMLGGMLEGSAASAGLGKVAVLLVAALTISTGLTMAATIRAAHLSGQVLAGLRRAVHAHVLRLPMARHDASHQGDLIALMTYEVNNLSQFLTTTLAGLPALLFTMAGSLALLFVLDPFVALVIPLLLVPALVVLRMTGRSLRKLAAQAREAEAGVLIAAEQDLAMLPATRAFAVEAERQAHYADCTQQAFLLAFRQARISAMIGPGLALLAGLGAVALLLASGRAGAAHGDAAGLVSLLLYAALLTRPMAGLADFYGRLQWARGTLARLDAVLAEPVEADPPGLPAPPPARGAITFAGIAFAYPGRPPLFEHLTLAIEPGEIVALTGPNGAGKSTLLHLLLRFYHPHQGRILLDGEDIARYPLAQLRRRIALVPQRPLLFNASLRENIAYGCPHAGEEAIAAAIRLAEAEAMVAALPDGLDTLVGDDGVKLSGGQRQRVGLARALLVDPPVLLFDEPTAMYDEASEAAFVARCRSALAGRTVLIVTHRPASLALANRIVRIENGVALEG